MYQTWSLTYVNIVYYDNHFNVHIYVVIVIIFLIVFQFSKRKNSEFLNRCVQRQYKWKIHFRFYCFFFLIKSDLKKF